MRFKMYIRRAELLVDHYQPKLYSLYTLRLLLLQLLDCNGWTTVRQINLNSNSQMDSTKNNKMVSAHILCYLTLLFCLVQCLLYRKPLSQVHIRNVVIVPLPDAIVSLTSSESMYLFCLVFFLDKEPVFFPSNFYFILFYFEQIDFPLVFLSPFCSLLLI